MCSMSTGHSRTHAPHVTQSHTTWSVTAFGTSGWSSTSPAASATTRSRRSMISSFGESGLPVAHAGQTSWQRPHSVHVNRSSICFRDRSFCVATPKRMSSSAASRSIRLGSRRPLGASFDSHTLIGAVPMCRCFEPGR